MSSETGRTNEGRLIFVELRAAGISGGGFGGFRRFRLSRGFGGFALLLSRAFGGGIRLARGRSVRRSVGLSVGGAFRSGIRVAGGGRVGLTFGRGAGRVRGRRGRIGGGGRRIRLIGGSFRRSFLWRLSFAASSFPAAIPSRIYGFFVVARVQSRIPNGPFSAFEMINGKSLSFITVPIHASVKFLAIVGIRIKSGFVAFDWSFGSFILVAR